jgi:tetratricopeptide (TPR) repeat protein/DNA-binding winged helix-turn-helix (wHTH) protein
MQHSLLKGFYLQDLLVEPTSGRVSGPDGDAHLKPKAVEVLLYLAARPFELVEREALLRAVWGEDQGSPEALNHAIGELRSGLGDQPEDPQLIQTVPTRGYRLLQKPRLVDGSGAGHTGDIPYIDEGGSFIGKLMRRGVVQAGLAYLIFSWLLIQVADAVTPILGLPAWFPPFIAYSAIGGFPIVLILAWLLEQSDGHWLLDHGRQSGRLLSGLERNYLSIVVAYFIAAAGAGGYQILVGFDVPATAGVAVAEEDTLLPVRPNSIAVLKFLNISGSDTAKIFSEGLCEDILDRLARIPGLSVSSRGDSWSLPDNASSDVVRKRLRVAYFLEGSVRVIGDELKVVVQLIESATGFHVFSRSFETQLTDHMDVQREITKLAVANLRIALPDDGNSISMMNVSEPDVDAYILYRRGKAILDEPQNVERIDEAVQLFKKALVLDPEYAAAHAGICGAEVARFHETRVSDAIKRAENACSAALSTNRNLGVVYSSIGYLYMLSDRNREAFNAFSRALIINPRDVKAMRGSAAIMQRRNEFDDAERILNEAIELQPGNWRNFNTLGEMYFNSGRYADAADAFRKVVFLDPDNWESLGNLGSALMMTGDYEAAVDTLNRSLNIEEDEYFLSNLGVVYYYLGEYDRAADIYRQAIEEAPRDVTAWLNLGDALRFTSQVGGAETAYHRAAELAADEIAIAPNSPAHLYRRAWAIAGIGDHETANSLIERSLRLAPDNTYGLYYDGLIKHARGEQDAAIVSLGRSIEQGYPVAMLATDPLLKDLREARDFKALVASAAE